MKTYGVRAAVVIPEESQLEEKLYTDICNSGLPVPLRQHKFQGRPPAEHLGVRPILRTWWFDLAWPDRRLVVEVEGGTWINGSHNRGKKYEANCIKYNLATLTGWRIVRVTTDMVSDGRALVFVEWALDTFKGETS